jgi:hypothetical protein
MGIAGTLARIESAKLSESNFHFHYSTIPDDDVKREKQIFLPTMQKRSNDGDGDSLSLLFYEYIFLTQKKK